MELKKYIKGRGAQQKTHNRFSAHQYELRDDFLNYLQKEGEPIDQYKTSLIDTFPKTIVNTVNSPDIPMRYSLNPYQGCEHGCVYCLSLIHI